jgi:hypothetical protein
VERRHLGSSVPLTFGRGGELMLIGDRHTLMSAPRHPLGAVLLVPWGILTVLWVASTVHLAADGEVQPVITALVAIALLALLAGMEGLEVAVIARWRVLYPYRSRSHLGAWLAARQLFVALIVTTATILANRKEVIVPFTSVTIHQGTLLKVVFDIVWTGCTVLWFAQIFPKYLAATNPDRYLGFLRAPLFPIVEAMRSIGLSEPGVLVGRAVERRLEWPLTREEEIEEAAIPREDCIPRPGYAPFQLRHVTPPEEARQIVLQSVAWLCPHKRSLATRPAGMLQLMRENIRFAPLTKPEFQFMIPLSQLECTFAGVGLFLTDAGVPGTGLLLTDLGAGKKKVTDLPGPRYGVNYEPARGVLAPYGHCYPMSFYGYPFSYEHVPPASLADVMPDAPGAAADAVDLGLKIIGREFSPLGMFGPFAKIFKDRRERGLAAELVELWKSALADLRGWSVHPPA